MKSLVLLFESLCNILQGDVTLDISLLVQLYTSLEFSEVRLLAFTEGTLGCSILYEWENEQKDTYVAERMTHLF